VGLFYPSLIASFSGVSSVVSQLVNDRLRFRYFRYRFVAERSNDAVHCPWSTVRRSSEEEVKNQKRVTQETADRQTLRRAP